MSKAEGCLFLRECVCLRPTSGACNKCGEQTKFDEENKCWYCDCQCNKKNCTVERNPSKKYFKVKSTKELFDEFVKLSHDVRNLSGIVQNDMVVDMEELKDWLLLAIKVKDAYSDLIKRTTDEILKKPL